jgi:hypothetical protein
MATDGMAANISIKGFKITCNFDTIDFIDVIAVIGWMQIATNRSKSPKLFTAKLLITTLAMIQISFWMVVNNPNQNLYFNRKQRRIKRWKRIR